MEPVETILVPISKAAGCTIICEAELSHDCTCRQTARAAIAALEDAGFCVAKFVRATPKAFVVSAAGHTIETTKGA
jgi:hypothetical protein